MIRTEIDCGIKVRKVEDLLEMPVIVRVNKFDEEGAKIFSGEMERAENGSQRVIPVVIDSYGGQVYSLLSMVDVVKSSKKPVATIMMGKAMSCGAVLFTCGSEGMRYMGASATLMIHDVSTGSFGKVEEIKADARECDRLNELIYGLMARNVGKPEKYFWDIVQGRGRADWFLTAEEAKSHNIANHIRIPEMSVKVKVEMEFA